MRNRPVSRVSGGSPPIRSIRAGSYDAAVIAVGHKEFREMGIGAVRKACRRNHVIYDIKYVFAGNQVDGRL